MQLPPITSTVSLCTICGKEYECDGDLLKGGLENLKRHYNNDKAKEHKEPKKLVQDLVCIPCQVTFKWKADFNRHICVKAQRITDAGDQAFTKYYQRSITDNELAKVISEKLSPLETYLVCFQEKISIQNVYPPLCLAGRQHTMDSLLQCGRKGGTQFIIDVLEEQWKKTDENGIVLDSLIEIRNGKDSIFKIPAEYLTPVSKKLVVKPNGTHLEVSLVQVPEKPVIVPEKLEKTTFPDSKDGTVYQVYVQDSLPPPHCYQQKELRGQNLFLSPEKIDIRALGRYTGMICKSLNIQILSINFHPLWIVIFQGMSSGSFVLD